MVNGGYKFGSYRFTITEVHVAMPSSQGYAHASAFVFMLHVAVWS